MFTTAAAVKPHPDFSILHHHHLSLSLPVSLPQLQIPIRSVITVSKEKTAKIIPNAVGLATATDKHVFGSLLSRDSTFKFMNYVWKRAARGDMAMGDMAMGDIDVGRMLKSVI
jgi:hypothetical protein